MFAFGSIIRKYCDHAIVNLGNYKSYKKISIINLILIFTLKNGADVECVDNNGKNALSYAKLSNSQECMQLLLFNGSQDNDLNSSINNGTSSHHHHHHPHQNNNGFSTSNNHANTLTRRSQSTSSNSHMAYEKLPFNVV